jgi:hypothetical protein
MRVIMAATAVLAALAVSGCDINTGPKTAPVACNCAAPAPPPTVAAGNGDTTPPARHRHRHAHRYAASYGGGQAYYWRREYSEVSVQTYDYRSGSHSYAMDESGGDDTGGSGGASAYASSGGSTEGGWVDGYGRGHGGAGAAVGGGDERGRLKPWHGYDIDCPDKPAH